MTRDQIIEEARTYIGTKFQHLGRLKGAGIDCIGLLVSVAKTLGLGDYGDPVYPQYAFDEALIPKLEKVMDPIEIEDAQPGDVLVFWMNRHTKIPQHVALKTDIGMLHTWQYVQKVVEHGLTNKWRNRLVAAFKFPGVE